MEPEAELVNRAINFARSKRQLTSTFPLKKVSGANRKRGCENIPSELKTPVPNKDW